MDNYIGRLLDNRYEILEVIGTGGMAVVYKALCHRLNRLVAIKILKDEYSRDEDFRRRFHTESQAVAMLSHPNIVSVYDVSRSGDIDYIVMELIEGITMKQYLDKKGCMNWREALHFSIQIAKALEHAHSRGIIHRDIKPHNIMLLKDGSVKVADFGIARIASAQNTLTREALGSVHYISPEQAKGGRVDNRADLYSLGVVMYQMLTGKTPYDGETPVAVAIQHINGNLVPPTRLNPSVPVGLEQIILRAMAVSPDDRYNSATDMLHDMEDFRRNPDMVFQQMPATPARSRQTAQQPAQPRTQQPRPQQPRPSTAAQKAAYSSGSGARRGAPEEKPAEKKNIGVIIGVIVCAVVLIIGVIAFTSLRSCSPSDDPTDTSDASDQLHTIPQFVGEFFEDIDQSKYPFLKFETEEENSDMEKGKVVRQSLDANAEIKGNRTILLTISLGPKTETMLDLTDRTQDYAEDWLNGLKMSLYIQVEEVYSEDVAEGKVVRTKPEANSQIASGDTVTLYVSSGKEPVRVPKVIGMSISNAISLLKDSFDVDYEYIADDADKDTVIGQSIAAGEDVPEGSKIILTVSDGPEETAPPETDPPETDPPETDPPETEPPEKTIRYALQLDPLESDSTVELRKGNIVVCSAGVTAGQTEVTLSLTGSGSQYYDVYINGIFDKIIAVDFDAG